MENLPNLSRKSSLSDALTLLVQAFTALINLIAKIIGYIVFGIICIIVLVIVFKIFGFIIAGILGLFGFHRRNDY